MRAQLFAVRRDPFEGRVCWTLVPVGVNDVRGEVLRAPFQSAFRRAMDLAGWGGPASLAKPPAEEAL